MNLAKRTRIGTLGRLAVVTLLAVVLVQTMAQSARAQAADRAKNSVAFTVPIDSSVDGIFFYDELTHDLRGAVLNSNGRFNVTYGTNLAVAMNKAVGKKIGAPIFVIVPGRASLRNKGGRQFAQGAIYVTELTTGHMISFGMQWNNSWRNQAKTIPPMELTPLHMVPFRSVQLEE